MDIRIANGEEARSALRSLGVPDDVADQVYRLRVAFDGEGFKFKVNEATWTPGYGGEEDNTRGTMRTEEVTATVRRTSVHHLMDGTGD